MTIVQQMSNMQGVSSNQGPDPQTNGYTNSAVFDVVVVSLIRHYLCLVFKPFPQLSEQVPLTHKVHSYEKGIIIITYSTNN